MDKGWLKNIESGINKYKNEIVPLIKQGYYGMAGMELQNAVFILSLATEKMGEDEFCANISILGARLEFLSKGGTKNHAAIAKLKTKVNPALPSMSSRVRGKSKSSAKHRKSFFILKLMKNNFISPTLLNSKPLIYLPLPPQFLNF